MRKITFTAFSLLITIGIVVQAEAGIDSVVGEGHIIFPPASVGRDDNQADIQQGFDEQQGVLLQAPLSVDGGGSIAAGQVVDSHMIFLKPIANIQFIATWTFDGDVIGVMSDLGGELEAASNGVLGASGTTYPDAYNGRGMEDPPNPNADYYDISGNVLKVSMKANAACGDWIRVVTDGVLIAEIDIKPGSYPNSINLGLQGVIPVAILSSDTFDATEVDPGTVVLAGASVAVRGKGDRYMAGEEDVNEDGLVDLTLKIDSENFDPGVEQIGEVCLTGETYYGMQVEGCDEIRIVPPE